MCQPETQLTLTSTQSPPCLFYSAPFDVRQHPPVPFFAAAYELRGRLYGGSVAGFRDMEGGAKKNGMALWRKRGEHETEYFGIEKDGRGL